MANEIWEMCDKKVTDKIKYLHDALQLKWQSSETFVVTQNRKI